jgi:membrane protein DedA with SNARE-associated domain
MPGSVDVTTVLLAAHHRQMWMYYAMMATVGAILGGYLTYRMARNGGKQLLERRLSPKKAKRVYLIFERWWFASVAIPAILPPPFPIVPALLAAGAMQYPTRKFLAALAVGRAIRFTILGYLGAHYGTQIASFFDRYYWPVLVTVIALAVVAGLYGLFEYKRRQKNSNPRAMRPKMQPRHRAA